jgi:hypothetical protein
MNIIRRLQNPSNSTRRPRRLSRTVLPILLLLAGTAGSMAQCDKNLVLTSSRTEYLNGSHELQRTAEEQSVIEISKTEIIIRPGNADREMKGAIQSTECAWKVPFKEGKTVIKARFEDEREGTINTTITLEGKDGKVRMLIEAPELQDRKIRVPVDEFKEKK